MTKKRQRCASCRCKDIGFTTEGLCGRCARADRAFKRFPVPFSSDRAFKARMGAYACLVQASPKLQRIIKARAQKLLNRRATGL